MTQKWHGNGPENRLQNSLNGKHFKFPGKGFYRSVQPFYRLAASPSGARQKIFEANSHIHIFPTFLSEKSKCEYVTLLAPPVTHCLRQIFHTKNRFFGSKIAVFDFLDLRFGFLSKKYTFWKKNLPILIDFSQILKFSPKTSPKIKNRCKIGQNRHFF